MQSSTDANQKATAYTYDARDVLDTITDPLTHVLDADVDALGRLSKLVENLNKKALDQAATTFLYDARDNLTRVTDPRVLNTDYVFDGFDELRQLSSPDSGVSQFSYDGAGNLTSEADARGITAVLSYDSDNRLVARTVPTSAQAQHFDFDYIGAECSSGEDFAVGRLGQVRDESGSTRYCYNWLGQTVKEVQSTTLGSTLEVSYAYNWTGAVSAMTYPSGAIVTYLRDENGNIKRIDAVPTLGAPQALILNDATYLPFGPLNAWTFGNNRTFSRTFDLNYRIDAEGDSAANGVSWDYTLDQLGNPTTIVERLSASSTSTRTLAYDGLNRLTSRKNGSTTVDSFKYDVVGNRTSKTVGATTSSYTYPAANNRLSAVAGVSRQYDADGSTTLIGTGTGSQGFTYDDLGRLRDYKVGGITKASYRHNAFGQRVVRLDSSNSANSRQFVYDLQGRLLGEYTLQGTRIQEYVWLDDTLVAVLSDHNGSTYQFVEADYLGTPRAVIHPSANTIIWRWNVNDSAFGDHAAQADPDGNGVAYTLSLRYPGQVLDPISGMVYNHFRDYEPATGRYLQSDPLGLAGDLSTYAYARSRPNTFIDPRGLNPVGPTVTADRNLNVVGTVGKDDMYPTVPGDELSKPRKTAAATTIMKYTFGGVVCHWNEVARAYLFASVSSMHVYFEVYTRPKLHTRWTDGDERQHINRFADWAEQNAPALLAAAEPKLIAEGCGDDKKPEDCVKAAEKRLAEELLDEAAKEANEQFTEWDQEGKPHWHHDYEAQHPNEFKF